MERNEATNHLEYLKSCTMVTEEFEGLDEALGVAIAALSDPWVACEDRLPTAEDADVDGYVLIGNATEKRTIGFMPWEETCRYWVSLGATHWMTPPAEPDGGGNDS